MTRHQRPGPGHVAARRDRVRGGGQGHRRSRVGTAAIVRVSVLEGVGRLRRSHAGGARRPAYSRVRSTGFSAARTPRRGSVSTSPDVSPRASDEDQRNKCMSLLRRGLSTSVRIPAGEGSSVSAR